MVRIRYPDRENGVESAGERPRAPLAFLRKIKETILEEEPERVIFSERGIGSVEFTSIGRMFGSDNYKVEYGFHEKYVENKFEFVAMGSEHGGGTMRQGSDLPSLGGKPGEFGRLFEESFDSFPFEFAELDAASVGHENLTSYEFRYETSVSIDEIRNSNF